MRLKTELYQKEQDKIVDKIVDILDLKNKNIYTLHELENMEEIQQKIMDLIPEIRRWFSCNNIKAVRTTDQIKRPWLSIIKNLLKIRYTIESKEYHFKNGDKWMRTQKYKFTEKLFENYLK